jgi:hypothetical protein
MAYPVYMPPVGGIKQSHPELTDHCRSGGETTYPEHDYPATDPAAATAAAPSRSEHPMFEINGGTFNEGDHIRFPRSPYPQGRVREYEIVKVGPIDIQVSSNGLRYNYSRTEASALGITHVAAVRDDEK